MNEVRRDRVLLPVAIPVGALAFIFLIVFGLSRILLNVPKQVSTAVALMVALDILAAMALVAARPRDIPAAAYLLPLIVPIGLGFLVATGAINAKSGEEKKSAPAVAAIDLVAHNVAFDKVQLNMTAGTDVVVKLTNKDAGIPHNFSVYKSADAKEVVFSGLSSLANGGTTKQYKFKAPPAGTYFFRCDIHPTMNGTLTAGAAPAP
jgi:plastocyanin